MSKKFLIILIVVLAALIILLLWQGLQADKDVAYGDNPELAFFAKCLAEKNIVMYGTPWCSWCQRQKALFGESFSFVAYVDCSKRPNECVSEGINATPTWIFPSTGSGQVPSASSGQVPSASSGQVPSASSGQVPSADSEHISSASSSGQTLESRKIEGYLTLEELAEKSGCELPK